MSKTREHLAKKTENTHLMISLHSPIPLGIPSFPLPPSSLTSFTPLYPFLQLSIPTILSSSFPRNTKQTFVSLLFDTVGCDKSGEETATIEPIEEEEVEGWRERWRESSPARDPPCANPNRWSEGNVQLQSRIRCSVILVMRWRVAVGFGLWMTECDKEYDQSNLRRLERNSAKFVLTFT